MLRPLFDGMTASPQHDFCLSDELILNIQFFDKLLLVVSDSWLFKSAKSWTLKIPNPFEGLYQYRRENCKVALWKKFDIT